MHIVIHTDIFTEHIYYTNVQVSTISLERVSPKMIFLLPPEKLVIEVKATGRFTHVDWLKNGYSLTSTGSTQEFTNYREIFVQEESTKDDFGLYEVSLFPSSPYNQINTPLDLKFIVTPPGI